MKRLFFIAVMLTAGSIGSYAQDACESGSVCVKQTVLERCADVADQLKAAKAVIEKFEAERGLSQAERSASQALIKGLNDYLAVKDRIIADYEQIGKMKDNVITLYQSLVERLTAQINKPKSGWQKLLQVLKEIALVAAGVTLGRGL